jgi:hypothetical protein
MRLTPYMSQMVKINHSKFIRGRQIHENFRAVQLTCRWLHGRHHPAVLLKVDLAKAFDTVAWPFLLKVLEHIGFPLRWRDWLSALLGTASTRVLINGRPDRRICHARGLRQGDLLSPLLFVIVMDVLNALILEADRHGELTPLPGNNIKHRGSLYADDFVMFLAPMHNAGLHLCPANPGFIRRRLWPVHQLAQVFDHTHSLHPRAGPGGAGGFPRVPVEVSWVTLGIRVPETDRFGSSGIRVTGTKELEPIGS